MICKLGLHKVTDQQQEDNTCCEDLKKELKLLADAEPYTTFLNAYNNS